MSISNTMAELMNAVRALNDGSGTKLSIDDAVKVLTAYKMLSGMSFVNAEIVYLSTRTYTGYNSVNKIDDISLPGQYLVKADGTIQNGPANDPCTGNGWGTLWVFKNDIYLNQFMSDNNQSKPITYQRSKNIFDNRPWTPWTKLGGGNS